MSGFSSPEFLLIVVLALVVLGPKRLPEIANKVGSWVGQARRMTRIMKRQLEEELNVDDINELASPETAFKATTASKEAKAAADAEAAAVSEADNPVTDEPAELDAPRPDHITNDDDTYSPLHADDDEKEKSA